MMREGWEYKKLGEVATFINGYAFKPDQWKEYGTPIVRIQNLNNPNAPYNYFDGEVPDKVKIQNGDLLISWSASLGAYIWNGGNAFLNQHIFKVAFDKTDVDKIYLKYAVTSKLETMAGKVHGATMKHIVKKDFDNTLIPYPPKSTQLAIVSELDKINELIRLKEEQLKDFDNLAQSIFYEMFGDPVENEMGWEVKKLSSLFKVSSSKRIMQEEWTKEGVPFLKVSDIVSLIKYGEVSPSTFISQLKFEKLEKANMVPMVGDILITSRGTLGLCYTIKTGDKFYFQDGMVTWLSENSGNIIPIYITYLFSNNHFLEVLAERANKSTVSYISIKQISQKKITIPPFPLQQLFAQRIEQIEHQKSEVQKAITDLETLLASRMQYWFE